MPTPNHDSDKEIQDMNTRLSALEHKSARAAEAFVKNDLGVPDYDGHRRAHGDMIEQDKVVQGYKRDTTKKVLEWLTVGAGVLIGQGALEWIKAHLK